MEDAALHSSAAALAKEVLVVTLVQINSPSSVVTPLVDLVFT